MDHSNLECFVNMNAKEAIERLEAKRYLRPNKWIALLPDQEHIQKDADTRLNWILHGILISIRENEWRLRYYLDCLDDYLRIFHQRLPKETAIRLIQLLTEAATLPDQDPHNINSLFETIQNLLSQSTLKRGDFIIPARPILELASKILRGKIQKIDEGKAIVSLLYLKKFYALEEVKELWETDILSHLSPLMNGMNFAMLCLIILPTQMTHEEHKIYGAGLWFPILWNLYESCRSEDNWTLFLLKLFYELEQESPGVIDWREYDEELFTRVLRSFQLIDDDLETNVRRVNKIAEWAAYRIGGSNSCLPHLERLLKFSEPLLHPSNSEAQTKVILSFFSTLTREIHSRYGIERANELTKDLRSPEYHLSDEDIRDYVSQVLPIILPAVFIDSDSNEAAPILQILAYFEPDLVLPKILEMVYSSLQASCEPHRFHQSLECLERVLLLLCQEKSPFPIEIENDLQSIKLNNKATSIRCHTIYILNELIDGIDINDVDKIVLVIQIISHIFYVIPNIDASSLVNLDPKDIDGEPLTDEERELCRLTALLPKIAEKAIEKIVTLIEVIASVPQRAEDLPIGQLNQFEGGDEKTLKKVVDQCIYALFLSASKSLRLKLAQRVLCFLRSNFIATFVAADMAESLVGSSVQFVPEIYEEFTAFICLKVNKGLDEFIESGDEKADIALNWWAQLVDPLGNVPCNTITPSAREQIMAVVDRLIEQTDIALYGPAVQVINGFIRWIKTYQARYPLEELSDKELPRWIPVRDWAKLCSREELPIQWHKPTKNELTFAQNLVNRYLGRSIERLMNPEKMSSEEIRRDLSIYRLLDRNLRPFLPDLDEIIDFPSSMHESSIPRFMPRTNAIEYEITLNGENLRLKVLDALEAVMKKGRKNRKDETRILDEVVDAASRVIDYRLDNSSSVSSRNDQLASIRHRLRALPSKEEKFTEAENYTNLGLHNSDYLSSPTSGFFTKAHKRVLKILIECAFCDYPEVREDARHHLDGLCGNFREVRYLLVDPIVLILNNSAQLDDQAVWGALQLICNLSLDVMDLLPYKNKIWEAILAMKVIDRPGIINALNQIASNIFFDSPLFQSRGEEDFLDEKKSKERISLNAHAQEFLDQLPKEDFWTPFLASDSKTRDFHKQLREIEERSNEELLPKLLTAVDSMELHGKQREIARVALWRMNQKKPPSSVLKLFLSQTKDGQPVTRAIAWHCIKHWLIANKPKTKKVSWIGPERDSSVPEFSHGLRSDNLFAAYDLEKLPRTEKDWNEMYFLGYAFGAYKWPGYAIDVERGDCGVEALENEPFHEIIVDFFTDSKNLEDLLKIWLAVENNGPMRKESSGLAPSDVATSIRYLIRNYGHVKGIQNCFRDVLFKLITSKKNEEQGVAAQLFFGIVKGSKHHSFSQLNDLWIGLGPLFKSLLENIHEERKIMWSNTIFLIVRNEDRRRYWWLIEALIESLDGSLTIDNSCHYAYKASLLWVNGWKDTQLRNRLVKKALDDLPTARLPGHREGIVNLLNQAVACGTANLGNDFSKVPESFRLGHIDEWVEEIYEKLADYIRMVDKTIETPLPGTKIPMPSSFSLTEEALSNMKIETPIRKRSGLNALIMKGVQLVQVSKDHLEDSALIHDGKRKTFSRQSSRINDDQNDRKESISQLIQGKTMKTFSRQPPIVHKESIKLLDSPAALVLDAIFKNDSATQSLSGSIDQLDSLVSTGLSTTSDHTSINLQEAPTPLFPDLTIEETIHPYVSQEKEDLSNVLALHGRPFSLKECPQYKIKETNTVPIFSPTTPAFAISADKCTSIIGIAQFQPSDQTVFHLRTLIELLRLYYRDGHFGATKAILATLPMIIQMAQEESDESLTHLALGGDLKRAACALIFDYMAPALIEGKYADSLLRKLEQTLNTAAMWKVRSGVLKYLQAAVKSNLFVFSKNARPIQVQELIMKGITDHLAEVRAEGAKCLMTLVYAGYFEIDDSFMAKFNKLCLTTNDSSMIEGGLLAICAIVQAYPFSCPSFMPKLIESLCSITNHGGPLTKKFTTHALREFRRTHRDSWTETTKVLGADLMYQVENACAPNYYA